MAKPKTISAPELLRDARLAVSDLQFEARSLVRSLTLIDEELRCARELHEAGGRTVHAERCARLSSDLRGRINAIEKFGKLTIDAAIADRSIPF